MTISEIYKYPFPNNLINDIGIQIPENIPGDYNATLMYVIMRYLPERYYKILLMRYEQMLTYEQIGDEFSISKERVRQIISYDLRKLRHPKISTILSKGLLKYYDSISNKQYEIGYTKGYFYGSKSVLSKEPDKVNLMENPIEYLDLKVRPYNCLKKKGISKISELCSMSEYDLIHIRNMGKGSVEEIKARLEEIGLELQK